MEDIEALCMLIEATAELAMTAQSREAIIKQTLHQRTDFALEKISV